MLRKAMFTLLLATAAASPALAHDGGRYGFNNRFENRIDSQQSKIEAGRRTGDITWTEGIKLRAEQRKVMKLRRQLASDGRLSWRDRKRLRRELNRLERKIYAEARDSRSRVWWAPRVGK